MSKRSLISLALIALLAGGAWTGVYYATPATENASAFTIAPGESADAIIKSLEKQGIVRSGLLFKVALRQSGLGTALQPGTYDLRGVTSYVELVRRLTQGGVAASELVVRIIEGWSLRDIAANLAAIGYPKADAFFSATGKPAVLAGSPDYSAEFPSLAGKPRNVSLEGYLFPDTYRVYRDATPEDLVRTFLKNFEKKITPDLHRRIAASGHSFFQTLTMASIVEREVRGDDDRRIVADIFWRRLANGIALQADSTVNYATGKSIASVTAADLAVKSPYNTYKYPDLPPGPICNPGLSAIAAAAAPTPNDYWYFLTDKDGIVYYAKTLAEHNRNKAKYLR